jgi:4'-phosphopantetheinyl transferase EntD
VLIGAVRDRCGDLLPEERQALTGLSERRRAEFSTGRVLARSAMQRAGIEAVPVLRNADRSPRWPEGIRGSLTHSRNLAAAAVSTTLAGVGIDLEQQGRLSAAAATRVLTAGESVMLQKLDGDFRWLATLAFSAKEAVYKAIYPSVGLYIGYREVTVALQPETATFSASYVGNNAANAVLATGQGQWWCFDEVVLTRFEIESIPPPTAASSTSASSNSQGELPCRQP